jgi:hypothetical protein
MSDQISSWCSCPICHGKAAPPHQVPNKTTSKIKRNLCALMIRLAGIFPSRLGMMEADRTTSTILQMTLSLLNYYSHHKDCPALDELKDCMQRAILELQGEEERESRSRHRPTIERHGTPAVTMDHGLIKRRFSNPQT